MPNKAQRGSVPGIKGSVPGMQGDGFASEPGGIMEVAMWLCALFTSWALILLGSDTQLCYVSSVYYYARGVYIVTFFIKRLLFELYLARLILKMNIKKTCVTMRLDYVLKNRCQSNVDSLDLDGLCNHLRERESSI